MYTPTHQQTDVRVGSSTAASSAEQSVLDKQMFKDLGLNQLPISNWLKSNHHTTSLTVRKNISRNICASASALANMACADAPNLQNHVTKKIVAIGLELKDIAHEVVYDDPNGNGLDLLYATKYPFMKPLDTDNLSLCVYENAPHDLIHESALESFYAAESRMLHSVGINSTVYVPSSMYMSKLTLPPIFRYSPPAIVPTQTDPILIVKGIPKPINNIVISRRYFSNLNEAAYMYFMVCRAIITMTTTPATTLSKDNLKSIAYIANLLATKAYNLGVPVEKVRLSLGDIIQSTAKTINSPSYSVEVGNQATKGVHSYMPATPENVNLYSTKNVVLDKVQGRPSKLLHPEFRQKSLRMLVAHMCKPYTDQQHNLASEVVLEYVTNSSNAEYNSFIAYTQNRFQLSKGFLTNGSMLLLVVETILNAAYSARPNLSICNPNGLIVDVPFTDIFDMINDKNKLLAVINAVPSLTYNVNGGSLNFNLGALSACLRQGCKYVRLTEVATGQFIHDNMPILAPSLVALDVDATIKSAIAVEDNKKDVATKRKSSAQIAASSLIKKSRRSSLRRSKSESEPVASTTADQLDSDLVFMGASTSTPVVTTSSEDLVSSQTSLLSSQQSVQSEMLSPLLRSIDMESFISMAGTNDNTTVDDILDSLVTNNKNK